MNPTDNTPEATGGMVAIETSQGPIAIHASRIAADDWNGFAKPSFTLDEVRAMSAHMTGLDGDALVSVHPETDVVTVFEEGHDEPYEVKPIVVDGVNVYPIGAGAWGWERQLDEA